MSNIHLIAVDHNDKVLGPGKLRAVYGEIKPTVILSEISPEDEVVIRRIQDEIRIRLGKVTDDQESIDRAVRLVGGFEYNTNREYAAEHGIEHVLADLPGRQIGNVLEMEVLTKIWLLKVEAGFTDLKEWVDNSYAARNPSQSFIRQQWDVLLWMEKNWLGSVGGVIRRIRGNIGKADIHMESVIRELHGLEEVIAFPVGMAHVMDSRAKRTLYSRLKDLNPERKLLI